MDSNIITVYNFLPICLSWVEMNCNYMKKPFESKFRTSTIIRREADMFVGVCRQKHWK